jgi:hypothetical protein
MKPQWMALCGAAVLWAACGCGSSNSKICAVQGRLTFKGQPMPGVLMKFEPDDINTKATSYGVTDTDGRFEMMIGGTPGVFKGKVKVFCEDPQAAMGGKATVAKEIETAYRELTTKYGHGKSTYELTIEKSEPDLKLDLN